MAQRLSLLPPDRAHMVIDATVLDVRACLATLMACPPVQGLDEDCLGTTEIVLAEALNNIVEHAYARFGGEIEVELWRHLDELRFGIKDVGLPMPDREPPRGDAPSTGNLAELPECGLGWLLIRALASDLQYRRVGDLNCLSFAVRLNNAA